MQVRLNLVERPSFVNTLLTLIGDYSRQAEHRDTSLLTWIITSELWNICEDNRMMQSEYWQLHPNTLSTTKLVNVVDLTRTEMDLSRVLTLNEASQSTGIAKDNWLLLAAEISNLEIEGKEVSPLVAVRIPGPEGGMVFGMFMQNSDEALAASSRQRKGIHLRNLTLTFR